MSSTQLQIQRPANDDAVVVQQRQKNDHHHPPSHAQQKGRQGTALTLPAMESSPYLKYSDLEQYKLNAYGSDQLGSQHDSKHNAAAAAAAAYYQITSIPKEEEDVASVGLEKIEVNKNIDDGSSSSSSKH